MMDPELRPTKVDRPSDVTGLVDTGKLVGLLNQSDAVAVMESIERISEHEARFRKHPGHHVTRSSRTWCGAATSRAADLADRYGDPTALNPSVDPQIVGAGGIFSQAGIRQRFGVPQDGGGHEAGGQRLCRRRHRHHGRLRLPYRRPIHRRAARSARRPLHGRLSGIRGPGGRAPDGLRVQRRLRGQ